MATPARILAALLLASPAASMVVRVRPLRMCSDATARTAPPDTSWAASAISSMLSINEADSILAEYDAGHRAAAARSDSEGMGGALTANAWSLTVEREPLAGAVQVLAQAAAQRDGRVMLGICADDPASGVAALKQWVGALGLPRGALHGMDKDGVPLDMSDFGACYVKYNSLPVNGVDAPGTALLSGYGGDFRGVYLNVDLVDGEFRQFAVLPLDLCDGVEPQQAAAVSLAPAPSPAAAVPAAAVPSIGSRVMARYGGKAAWYAGTVDAIGADGSFSVRYDDGDFESGVAPELVREAGAAPTSPSSPPLSASSPSSRPPAAGGRRQRRFVSRGMGGAAVDASTSPRAANLASAVLRGKLRTLHTQGWVVLPVGHGGHLVDTATLDAIRTSKFEPIFNGQPEGEPPLRHQGRSWEWAAPLTKVFEEALQEHGLLACSGGGGGGEGGEGVAAPTKVVRDMYALRSLPCATDADANTYAVAAAGRQPAHSDASPPADGAARPLESLADADMPLSAMLAVQQGTRLWVYPSGCDADAADAEEAGAVVAPVLIELELGDLLVWRGDLVHAGAGYAEEHVRVHAYIDPPDDIYLRPRGRTNLCGGGAGAN